MANPICPTCNRPSYSVGYCQGAKMWTCDCEHPAVNAGASNCDERQGQFTSQIYVAS